MPAASLNKVLDAVRATAISGAVPVVVFDLDSTLFCTGPRNLKILRDFCVAHSADHPGVAAVVEHLVPADMGWNVNEALKARGLHDATLHARLKKFWAERFFTNEYVLHDEPLEGAVAFAAKCRAEGALLYYLTGRHVGGMEQGTAASLVQHGFPLYGGHAILHLKPNFETADRAFKQQALTAIAALGGTVVATFENEPGNANLFLRSFPGAQHFLLLTVHSPDAEAPDAQLIAIPSFRC
ncbi:MAG: HAD family hydrolase [Planctomycetes bacterium]|nr:HAD family hydrolase [Planctomycetota bacterium]